MNLASNLVCFFIFIKRAQCVSCSCFCLLYKVQNSHITKDNNSVYVCDEKKETNDDKSGKMIHRLTDIKTNKQKPVKENKKSTKTRKSFVFIIRFLSVVVSLFLRLMILFSLLSAVCTSEVMMQRRLGKNTKMHSVYKICNSPSPFTHFFRYLPPFQIYFFEIPFPYSVLYV